MLQICHIKSYKNLKIVFLINKVGYFGLRVLLVYWLILVYVYYYF